MELEIRDATAADLPAIVAMLADDPLGRAREDPSLPLAPSYLEAFAEIEADPRMALLVAVEGGRVVATLQLAILPSLSKKGARRALLQAVRVVLDRRRTGIGARLVEHAMDMARARGCTGMELTSHQTRVYARRFYARLGFKPTHVGFTRGL